MYLNLVITDGEMGVKLPIPYLFWKENCYWLNWNLPHILSNLKSFLKKNSKTFWMQCDVFTDVIICQCFLQESYLYLFLVRLKTLDLFFLCFLAFCEFQCLFYKNTFVSTFFMGMFYFILIWKGLKTIRLKMILMFPATLKNNTPMQLRFIFHKAVNSNKLKV